MKNVLEHGSKYYGYGVLTFHSWRKVAHTLHGKM